MIGLEIKGITKRFGAVTALNEVSLAIEDGELFFLLGPSGCGKTTLLRIVAGFCLPDAGEVLFHGENLLARPPEKRNIGMVFQNYSLWPHMTVADNVAYGLKIRKRKKPEIEKMVDEALAMVGMRDLADRRPAALSGGQQQRVALARALVYEPEIVLLDEPLSNLDAKLRKEMRREIRALHERLGITMIYVTHDQEEASSMADRIALFRDGIPVQTDTPRNLYRAPGSTFAAEFFGAASSVPGTVAEVLDQAVSITFGDNKITAAVERDKRIHYPVGQRVTMIIRPEDVVFAGNDRTENVLSGAVVRTEFLGGHEMYAIDIGGTELTLHCARRSEQLAAAVKGERVTVVIDRNAIHLLGGRP